MILPLYNSKLHSFQALKAKLRIGLFASFSLFLAACSLPFKQDQTLTDDSSNPSNILDQLDEPKARPFSTDTLYSLLTAELAGSRERYDIALRNYLLQAYQTRDPGVTARATHIARYLNVNEAVLEASSLWVELQPNNLEARFILATALAKNGQFQQAVPHSTYLLQHNGSSTFQSLAAQASQGTDTQREALINSYQELLLEYPKNTQLLTGLGILQQQQGNLTIALRFAQKALKIEPKLISAAILEARLLMATGKDSKALERLQKMLEKFPDDNRLRLQYARLLSNLDLPAAHKQFLLLRDQAPHDSEILFSLALITKELDQLPEAQALFEQLIPYSKRRSSAYYYLGKIAEQLEDTDLALSHYLKVEPGPDFTAALLHSSDILIRDERIDEAKLGLSNARLQFPSQSERLYLLESEVLSNHKQYQATIETLSTALQEYPSSTALLYSRAMTHELLGDFDLLETDLTSLLKYEPNNATALNALGYTLANRNIRLDDSLQMIEKALQIKPGDPAIIDSMGWIQFRLGNYENALLRLRQAMQAMPDHEIAAHLGEVLWVMGSQQEAQQIWQQGLKLNPDSDIIKVTQQRLNAADSE